MVSCSVSVCLGRLVVSCKVCVGAVAVSVWYSVLAGGVTDTVLVIVCRRLCQPSTCIENPSDTGNLCRGSMCEDRSMCWSLSACRKSHQASSGLSNTRAIGPRAAVSLEGRTWHFRETLTDGASVMVT